MDTLMEAKVFFFISSVGFIILGVMVAIFLVYLIRFMKISTRLMERIEKDVDSLSDGAKDMLLDMRESMAFRFLFGKRKRRKAESK